MHAFTRLLSSCLPGEDALLEPILTRFNREFPHEAMEPSVEVPFTLCPADIDCLLELARKHKSEQLLIALANMGTVELDIEKNIKDPSDPFIGRRDEAIEAAIISKAMETQARKDDGEEQMSRVVYGLSGNPPTLNHRRFIEHLLKQGDVTVVLNRQSPLKSPDSYVAQDIRFEMLKSMIDKLDEGDKRKCNLSRLEIDRLPPSRMVVTMSILTLLSQKNEQFILALGLDALSSFRHWYQWQALGRLCNIKFFNRPGETMSDSDIEANLQLLDEGGVRNTHIVFNDGKKCRAFMESYSTRSASPAEIPDITEGSATQVRAYYRKRRDYDLEPLPPRELNVDETVHGLIQRYGLFRPALLPKTAVGEAPSDAAVSEKKR